jgi:perosamine synthetase
MSSQPVTLHYYRGRVALSAILRGLGVAPGDEVVLQAYTCSAVTSPLVHLGLRPVFVDIDRGSLTMNPALLRDAISERTRAIVVQHTFGIRANMSAALKIAADAGIPVIEDCAHVLEAGSGVRSTGTRGAAAFFSYEWGKPVVAGVGGTAVVNDPELAARMRAQYGTFVRPPLSREFVMALQYLGHRAVSRLGILWKVRSLYRRLAGWGLVVGSYDDDPGINPEYGWRMTRTVQRRLASRTASARDLLDWRRTIAARYWTGLNRAGFAGLAVPDDAGMVLMRVPVTVADKQRVLRAAVDRDVELGDWFGTPVHPLVGKDLAAVGYVEGSCPNAEWAADRVVTLPVRADTRIRDVDRALDLLSDLHARGDA